MNRLCPNILFFQRRYLIFHQAVNRDGESAIRKGKYKLVKTWKKNQLELFDIVKDVGEENDLSEKLPEVTRDLDSLLTAFLKDVGAETRNLED